MSNVKRRTIRKCRRRGIKFPSTLITAKKKIKNGKTSRKVIKSPILAARAAVKNGM